MICATKGAESAGFNEFEDHDATGLAALVARGETTPEALLEAAIERVEARNDAVNAVTNRLCDDGRRAIAMRVLEATASLAADLGHRVEEADPAIDGEAVVPTFLTLMGVNTMVNLSSHPSAGRTARKDEDERIAWLTAKLGEATSGADYVRATRTMHRLGRRMAAFHDGHDVPLTPGLATGTAVELGWLDMMMDDVEEYWRRVSRFSPFTVWFNLTGQPAVTLPIGESAGGLPVAVQAVAPYGDEKTLFRFAAQLESARPWFDRKPALVRGAA